jgi:hypothetical protein
MKKKKQRPKWPFPDAPNVAVFTTQDVIDEIGWIHYVSHDSDDGAWQFHSIDDRRGKAKEARLVGLETIVRIDPSVKKLADLPLGWIAWRENRNSAWHRQPKEE